MHFGDTARSATAQGPSGQDTSALSYAERARASEELRMGRTSRSVAGQPLRGFAHGLKALRTVFGPQHSADRAQILRCHGDGRGGDILLQVGHGSGPGNRQHHRCVMKEPGEGGLGG